jgi:hypothetical protein
MMTEASESDTPSTTLRLDTAEARVLACLIEKEATTPEQYPLTANAVQVACNQKTAREPVLELDAGTVGHALRTLEDKRLVRVVHGARALRYDHRTDDIYAISPEQRIVLALLMLRGPQTIAELFARSERMGRFVDIDAVRAILDRLSTRTPSLVTRLDRSTGQREDRYAHLLSGAPAFANTRSNTSSPAPSSRSRERDHEDFDERLARLEMEVAELRAAVSALQECS